jgi:iron(III) transport system permease protein
MPPAPPAQTSDRPQPEAGGHAVRALGAWARGTSNRSPAWSVTAAIAATLVVMPVAAILVLALTPSENIWGHLAASVLPGALRTTFLLCSGAGLLSLVTGTAAAWLVTMYHFPGRAVTDRLLVLPLAMPVYIVAYAYVDLLDFAGPVQTALRSLGEDWRQTRFADIRSLPGAILIFTSVLYPYVYLSARASFVQQSVCVLEVARTLGQTALGTFRAVALPMARPALAAGVTLVVMECLNDLGAVQYLGVETLSASIYATWLQRSNLAGAAQLASVMLMIIAALMIAERRAEGGAHYQNTTGRQRAIAFETLDGWRGYAALGLVLIPVVIGFAVPFAVLCRHAFRHFGDQLSPGFLGAARNSLILALVVSLIAVILSLFFGYAARVAKSPLTTASARIAGLGYAVPGTVLGLGLLVPLAAFDNTLDGWLRAWTGFGPGLMLSGSLAAVTLALVIRFLAVAQGSIDAGLGRVSVNLDAAASTLGASALGALFRVHLPIIAPALGAAALMVFVDAMKELPATLLLRPFNFETLATHIYGLAAAEQFEEAALGAVTIVLTGLLPVLLLHKTIARSHASRN